MWGVGAWRRDRVEQGRAGTEAPERGAADRKADVYGVVGAGPEKRGTNTSQRGRRRQ